jgi:hypothetical protein
MNDRIYPAPGVFARVQDPEETRELDWTLDTSVQGGRTNLHRRVMQVPSGDTDQDYAIRQHEMLHAAWSPVPDTPPDMAMMAAEDARIETLATAAGIHREKHVTPDEIARALFGADRFATACYAVAGIGSPHEQLIREAVDRRTAAFMHQVRDIYRDDTSPEAAERVAGMLRELLPPGTDADSYVTTLPSHDYYHLDEGEKEQSQGTGLSWGSPIWEVDFTEIGLPPLQAGEHRWGIPVVETPPRPRRLVAKRIAKGTKPRWRDTGAVPGAMHRLTTDGKVFREHSRVPGGTVLIDMSGSMEIAPDDVEDLVKDAPAATIAGYWGIGGGKGVIRVLASEGTVVNKHDFVPTGTHNEVDLPAIEWLARQPGPRFWVCDGAVTVTDDRDPSSSQKEFFWKRLRALGISWVEYYRGGPEPWPALTRAAMRKHR